MTEMWGGESNEVVCQLRPGSRLGDTAGKRQIKKSLEADRNEEENQRAVKNE